MPIDNPRLGGYTLQNPPDQIVYFPEVVQQVNELADGGHRQRILGYRLRVSLGWDENWIRLQDLTGLIAVANDISASLTFLPRPDTRATLSYSVIWLNKFSFMHTENRFSRWGGSIELVTPTVTSTVGDLP